MIKKLCSISYTVKGKQILDLSFPKYTIVILRDWIDIYVRRIKIMTTTRSLKSNIKTYTDKKICHAINK